MTAKIRLRLLRILTGIYREGQCCAPPPLWRKNICMDARIFSCNDINLWREGYRKYNSDNVECESRFLIAIIGLNIQLPKILLRMSHITYSSDQHTYTTDSVSVNTLLVWRKFMNGLVQKIWKIRHPLPKRKNNQMGLIVIFVAPKVLASRYEVYYYHFRGEYKNRNSLVWLFRHKVSENWDR